MLRRDLQQRECDGLNRKKSTHRVKTWKNTLGRYTLHKDCFSMGRIIHQFVATATLNSETAPTSPGKPVISDGFVPFY